MKIHFEHKGYTVVQDMSSPDFSFIVYNQNHELVFTGKHDSMLQDSDVEKIVDAANKLIDAFGV